jgi:hypothetical protein
MEGCSEVAGGEDFWRRTADQGAIRPKEMHGGEVPVNQVKVVDGGKDGDAFASQAVQQVDEFGLSSDVEVLRGFIEQQELCFLRETKRNLDALAFAATKLVEDAMAEQDGIGEVERAINGESVFA